MHVLVSGVRPAFRTTLAAVRRPRPAAFGDAACAGAAAFLALAGLAKLLAIGNRDSFRLPRLGVVTAPLATGIAVLEVFARRWLAHVERPGVVRVFACLYGILAVVAFAGFLKGEEGGLCLGDLNPPPVIQALLDTLSALACTWPPRGRPTAPAT